MVRRRLAVAAALVIAGGASLGWTIARKLTAPVGPRSFGLGVRGVEVEVDCQFLLLDRTRDTEVPGIYNLWFERGGWAQLAEEVLHIELGQIARVVTGRHQV